MRPALLLLALVACRAPDLVTGHGVAVYGPGNLHADELAELEELTLRTAAGAWGVPLERLAECLPRLAVTVHPARVLPCPAGSPERFACYGLHHGRGEVELATRRCAYHSAFAHELAHHLLECAGRPDLDHSDPIWPLVIANDKWITEHGAHRDRCHRPEVAP
jgi:hypothetical protein